jgi:hypothetical protein
LIKYNFGWSLIAVSIVNIAVNMGIMIKESVTTLKKVYRIIRVLIKKLCFKKDHPLEQSSSASKYEQKEEKVKNNDKNH